MPLCTHSFLHKISVQKHGRNMYMKCTYVVSMFSHKNVGQPLFLPYSHYSPYKLPESHAHKFDKIYKINHNVQVMFRVISNKISINIDHMFPREFNETVWGGHPMKAFQSPGTQPSEILPCRLFLPRRCHIVALRAPTNETPPYVREGHPMTAFQSTGKPQPEFRHGVSFRAVAPCRSEELLLDETAPCG